MATPNPISVAARSEIVHTEADKGKPLTDGERQRMREYYRSLSFKEFLAACPIDGINLTRELEHPREGTGGGRHG